MIGAIFQLSRLSDRSPILEKYFRNTFLAIINKRIAAFFAKRNIDLKHGIGNILYCPFIFILFIAITNFFSLLPLCLARF